MQPSQPVKLPETFTAVFGMGAPVGFYPASNWNRWSSLVAGLVFFFGGGLVGLFGLYTAYSQSQLYGPAVFMNNLLPYAVFAGIFILLGLWSFWSAYANWNKAVVLYPNGIAYKDNKGLQTWRWEEVARFLFSITKHYTNGIYTGTMYVYTGASASVSNIPNLAALLSIIDQITGINTK